MKDDKVYIRHIFDAIETAERYVKGMTRDEFLKDGLRQDAVIRQLEVVGEAAKNVSAEYKEQTPKIEWREIMDMRNKLIHEYFGVDIETVWDVVEKDVPALKELIKNQLSS